mgnify:CR=1 FL=1
MITAYKDRDVYSTTVDVYRNLNRDMWSICAVDGPHKGKVIGHADELVMLRAVFRVSEKSRQRALREGVRNVHAKVRGALVTSPVALHDGPFTWVRYNPTRCGHFTVGTDTLTHVYSAPEVLFTPDGRVYI